MATTKKTVKKAVKETKKATRPVASTAKKVVKLVVKPVKSTAAKTDASKQKTKPAKTTERLHAEVSIEKTAQGVVVSVLDTDGKKSGTVTLPAALFAAKVNQQLLAQAVRVYLANQRVGHAATKTRGQVEGSTRKIYKQKGTGNARHGSIRAPIFVGGGIVFGPTPRDYRLDMPKVMKTAALASAFSTKLGARELLVVNGLADLGAKTKPVAAALDGLVPDGRVLLLTHSDDSDLLRASRNIGRVEAMPARMSHPYAVVSHTHVLVTKSAVKELVETFVK